MLHLFTATRVLLEIGYTCSGWWITYVFHWVVNNESRSALPPSWYVFSSFKYLYYGFKCSIKARYENITFFGWIFFFWVLSLQTQSHLLGCEYKASIQINPCPSKTNDIYIYSAMFLILFCLSEGILEQGYNSFIFS